MTPEIADSFNYEKTSLGKSAFATIYSTCVGCAAYESEKDRMGYFSLVFDQALRGAAYNSEGNLTLAGLIKYLQVETPAVVKLNGQGFEQTPYAVVGGYLANELVLATRVSAQHSTTQRSIGNTRIRASAASR